MLSVLPGVAGEASPSMRPRYEHVIKKLGGRNVPVGVVVGSECGARAKVWH